MVGEDLLNKLILSLALILASCGYKAPAKGGGGGTDQNPVYHEHERNNSIPHAQFIGTFGAPDLFHLEGSFNAIGDVDVYWLWTTQPQLTGFSIHTTNGAVTEAYLFGKNDGSEQLIPIGHFMGDPGALYVTDWPTYPGNAGMYLILSSPSGIMANYNVEMWAH